MPTSRIRAPYEILCKVLGAPMHHVAADLRVVWDVDVDGAKARVFPHPDDKPISLGTPQTIFESPYAIWHVEAEDDARLEWVCARLSERVIEAVSKAAGPRTLSAGDKDALNGLLKSGVPFAEAMKRVQLRTDDTAARALYAWPMKDQPLFGGTTTVEGAVSLAQHAHDDRGDDDDGDDGEGEPAPPPPAHAAGAAPAAPAKKVVVGPPLPSDLPRATVEASYEKLRALLGEPEDEPIPFVSTRWRFVLDPKRTNPVVRWEDEPSDDPRDVDAAVFDRMSRFDARYAARQVPRAQWTVTSTSSEHLERVVAWLTERTG